MFEIKKAYSRTTQVEYSRIKIEEFLSPNFFKKEYLVSASIKENQYIEHYAFPLTHELELSIRKIHTQKTKVLKYIKASILWKENSKMNAGFTYEVSTEKISTFHNINIINLTETALSQAKELYYVVSGGFDFKKPSKKVMMMNEETFENIYQT